MSSYDTERDISRMMIIGCSDATVNHAISGIHDAFSYFNNYKWGMESLIFISIYIDYFGLLLCYGGTWRKLHRFANRWFCLPCRCFKYCFKLKKRHNNFETEIKEFEMTNSTI